MARTRVSADMIFDLSHSEIETALKASSKAASITDFYRQVGMRNVSRSYFVVFGKRLHSLKAVAAYAVQQTNPAILARDFHALDVAKHFRELGFHVSHNPPAVEEERERQWIQRLSRNGQAAFRAALIDLYGRCALSNCTTITALEAAHIRPFAKSKDDKIMNGILLRADLHKLFDAGLLAIDPRDGSCRIAQSCSPYYDELQGAKVFLPEAGLSLTAFQDRWDDFSSTT